MLFCNQIFITLPEKARKTSHISFFNCCWRSNFGPFKKGTKIHNWITHSIKIQNVSNSVKFFKKVVNVRVFNIFQGSFPLNGLK